MKKKTFFLSSLVAVALFVAALSFTSCNKEDVDYDSVNESTYVVTPDSPKSNESYPCPWCNTMIAPHGVCVHHYGLKPISEAVYCSDPNCPLCPLNLTSTNPQNPRFTNRPVQHRHVFDVCSFGHATHYHLGGSTGAYDHHTHAY